jgi:transcriptional regulator with XRE-family HTH domain
MSQAQLARRMGEQPQWVNRRLNPKPGNQSTIEADELPRFARALGVPCSVFFAGSGCPEVRQRELSSPDYLLDEGEFSPEDVARESLIEDLFDEYERPLVRAIFEMRKRYQLTHPEGAPSPKPEGRTPTRQPTKNH